MARIGMLCGRCRRRRIARVLDSAFEVLLDVGLGRSRSVDYYLFRFFLFLIILSL